MGEGLVISGDRRRTREALLARSNRASTGFDAIGVGPGDSVALMLRNDFPFFEATFAAGRLLLQGLHVLRAVVLPDEGAFVVGPFQNHGLALEVAELEGLAGRIDAGELGRRRSDLRIGLGAGSRQGERHAKGR